MRKFVVISVNENPEYLFYVPLVVSAWKKFGWDVILIRTCKSSDLTRLVWKTKPPDIEVFLDNDKYPSAMVAQVSRLYAAISVNPEDYIMTSDVDMLPLSDYWKFNPELITVWGHDLTSYNHMPICYIGMKASRWIEVMGISSSFYNELINRDLDSMPNAKSSNPEKAWCVDQDLITDRINAVQFEKEFVHRGVYDNGYPIGRVDRSAWRLNHEVLIDAHMPRQIWRNLYDGGGIPTIMGLFRKVWPEEDLSWLHKYIVDFNTHFYNKS